MAAAAHAQTSYTCPDGQFPFNTDSPVAFGNPACADLADVQMESIPVAPAIDFNGATLVLSQSAPLNAAFPNNLFFVMLNNSGRAITLERDGGLYLHPRHAEFPRVALSLLASDVVIADGAQRGFSVVMADPDDRYDGTGAPGKTNIFPGVRYYSMPAPDCEGRQIAGNGMICAMTDDECSARIDGAIWNNANSACECRPGFNNNADPAMCAANPPDDTGGGNNNTPPVGDNPTPPQRGKADFAQRGGVAVGLMGFMVALHYLGGGAEDFSFSPDFGYAITESGYSYKYGGRVDFRKDAWSLYWTAGQRNANGDWGDFRYASGGEYDGGFWRAAFSESVVGETTNYDFSLSADYAGGIWKVSPEFFADARYKNGEFAMTNSFRISGELRFDDWRFAASGSAERVRLSAVRRF